MYRSTVRPAVSAWSSRKANAPSEGILAHGGTDQICASVQVDLVPADVPTALAGLVRPVRDSTGQLTDWDIRFAALASGHDEEAVEPVLARFVEFRRSYAVDYPLGERAFAQALAGQLNSLAQGNDTLPDLRATTARFDAGTSRRLGGADRARAGRLGGAQRDGMGRRP
jgi:hypothetical protein